MSARVTSARGKLALRIHWRGFPGSPTWEGLGHDDTEENRRAAQALADAVTTEIKSKTWTPTRYLHYFPDGNRAHLFAGAVVAPEMPTLGAYYQTWVETRSHQVRAALYRNRTYHVPHYLLPLIGHLALDQITPRVVDETRTALRKQGLKASSTRYILQGHLRPLLRDAREIDGLACPDPFVALRRTWRSQELAAAPDPFTRQERADIVGWFWSKRPAYAPAVVTLFHVGMRPGEAMGLRWRDIDLGVSKITVARSRVMGVDAAPKTAGSLRTITVLPEVIAALRVAAPLHLDPDGHVFRARGGMSLRQEQLARQFAGALRALTIRPRKLYACRHTFISLALEDGANPSWVASYCGTSLTRIDANYRRWMTGDDDQLSRLQGAKTATRFSSTGTNSNKREGSDGSMQ